MAVKLCRRSDQGHQNILKISMCITFQVITKSLRWKNIHMLLNIRQHSTPNWTRVQVIWCFTLPVASWYALQISWRCALLLWVRMSIRVFSVVPEELQTQTHSSSLWHKVNGQQTESNRISTSELDVCSASSLKVHTQVSHLPIPSMAFLKAAASSPGLKPAFSLTVPRAVDLVKHGLYWYINLFNLLHIMYKCIKQHKMQ